MAEGNRSGRRLVRPRRFSGWSLAPSASILSSQYENGRLFGLGQKARHKTARKAIRSSAGPLPTMRRTPAFETTPILWIRATDGTFRPTACHPVIAQSNSAARERDVTGTAATSASPGSRTTIAGLTLAPLPDGTGLRSERYHRGEGPSRSCSYTESSSA